MLLKTKSKFKQYKGLMHLLNFKFTMSKNLYLIFIYRLQNIIYLISIL